MALSREQKQKVVEELKEKIDRQKAIAIIDIGGVKVKDISQLRRAMKEKDCELKVSKKTLIQLAFKEKRIETNVKELEGEIALAFGYEDEFSPFKTVHNMSAQVENLKILGGIVEGRIIDKEEAIVLATLPAREELLAKLANVFQAPISGFCQVLQGNIKGLIFALSAIKK